MLAYPVPGAAHPHRSSAILDGGPQARQPIQTARIPLLLVLAQLTLLDLVGGPVTHGLAVFEVRFWLMRVWIEG